MPRPVPRSTTAAASAAGLFIALLGAPLALAGGDGGGAPAAPRDIKVTGGEDWRRSPSFTITWTNPEHKKRIVAALYRLCQVEAQRRCEDGKHKATNVQELRINVPRPAEYTLTVYLRDSEGRDNPNNRSRALHLRYDNQAPTSRGLQRGVGGDPALISLTGADALSGVLQVEIQLRRDGGGWDALPTTTEPSGRARAQIPDLRLAAGTYEARAVIKDRAGNQAFVQNTPSGGRLRIMLPLRGRTSFTVRGEATGTVRRCSTVSTRVRGRLQRRQSCTSAVARRPLPFPATVPVELGHGDRIAITGKLQGPPRGSRSIQVIETPRTPGLPPRTSTVRTDAAGAFHATLAPGPSRTIELRYAGDDRTLASSTRASVLVPADGTLTVSRRVVANRESVRFSGRLLGEPIPAEGRTVALQAYFRGAWRTFATPNTDAAGAWSHVYRFGATRGRTAYRFRVVIHREAGYPYETGITPIVVVTVRGR